MKQRATNFRWERYIKSNPLRALDFWPCAFRGAAFFFFAVAALVSTASAYGGTTPESIGQSQRKIVADEGSVSIAGSAARILISTEVYDPKSGVFTRTGKMLAPRMYFCATVLNNGNVLVTGGQDAKHVPIASAELFVPARGQFIATGAMVEARTDYTATLLRDGRVLIFGGEDVHGENPGAEIYDPETGRFTQTSKRPSARAGHVAILLGNGDVLIADGYDSSWGVSHPIETAELYEPKSGNFVPTGDSILHFWWYSLATARIDPGTVFLLGGYTNQTSRSERTPSELYHVSSGRFTEGPAIDGSLADCRASPLPDGRIIVAGCINMDTQEGVSHAELFDPKTQNFRPTGALPAARTNCSVTTLRNGKVLIAGGNGRDPDHVLRDLATAELY
ncbi:MAG: kelch repeat-containing protein, partial [Candidatus Binataceae bacterium]